ncbi:MAG: sodium:solute symporter [Bacteroidetes bacterium]|jgi:Na+/proline symporter|nr:sodium:solute symporter [Bacteroidota bacterium]
MHWIDWSVLFGTLIFITVYGIYKTRGIKNEAGYLASDKNTPWWAIGLSIMATQASAITFLSTPGLGYQTGLEFVQFYFGLPIAMIIIAFAFVPLYHKLKIYTAYEYLEKRFDGKTRLLTASLFLVQRGLAAGITIYAPSIILSQILGLPLHINILVIGILVILYTVSGGTNAVTQTHKQQMAVIFAGLIIAFVFLYQGLSQHLTGSQIIDVASVGGRLKAIDWNFNLHEKYNVWSGLIAGTFLMLSYFGTDQSQVQRYISGKSIKEIRTGLYFNAILKIPMQFFILLLGVFVFVFYQVNKPPIHFDELAVSHVQSSDYSEQFDELTMRKNALFETQKALMASDFDSYIAQKEFYANEKNAVNSEINAVIKQSGYNAPVEKESDFVFITFVLDFLPIGLIGLLMAVIFSAAMSSTAAELNALATTTVVDYYKNLTPETKQKNIVTVSKWMTAGWGLFAIAFALMAQFLDSLVEAVNILGSLFYGTVLGVFLVGFYAKQIKGNAVFIAALISETVVLLLYFFDKPISEFIGYNISVGYLWYNLIAAILVFVLSYAVQKTSRNKGKSPVIA